MGLVFTTAGKAGFITGLYVVLTPLLGLLWRQKTSWNAWGGAVLAVIGLYLLTVEGPFSIGRGDGLVLLGAFFWAGHVQLTGWLVQRLDALWLSVVQFAICALLSAAVACCSEPISLSGLQFAAPAILYGGLLSVGVAYTLQVVGQKNAPPPVAAGPQKYILLNIKKRETPRLCRGGSSSLTYTGVHRRNSQT
jgi:drug/metabolite transporter (DMT)-like permease